MYIYTNHCYEFFLYFSLLVILSALFKFTVDFFNTDTRPTLDWLNSFIICLKTKFKLKSQPFYLSFNILEVTELITGFYFILCMGWDLFFNIYFLTTLHYLAYYTLLLLFNYKTFIFKLLCIVVLLACYLIFMVKFKYYKWFNIIYLIYYLITLTVTYFLGFIVCVFGFTLASFLIFIVTYYIGFIIHEVMKIYNNI